MKNLTYIFDIGSSKISLLACDMKKGNAVIITSIDKLYDGFMDGEFFSAEELPNIFKDLISTMSEKVGQKISSVYVGVPSEFSACVCKRVTRHFVEAKKLTSVDIDKLFDGVNDYSDINNYEVLNYSPLQFNLDGIETIEPINKRVSELVMDCSYILVKKSFISLIQKCMEECGVAQVEYVSAPLGQAIMCLQNRDNPLKPVAVVDVGHIVTSVAVVKGEGLLLLSSFSLGGGHITADIMQINNKSFLEAELIKRKVSLTVQTKKDERYIVYNKGKEINSLISITNDVVKARIENIANVINKVLAVDEMFKDIPIYITGDGICNFKGAKNVLEAVTNRKIYDYKVDYDNWVDKYQTSKYGLAQLIKDLI